MDDRKYISTDTTAWSNLSSEHGCQAEQKSSEAVWNKLSKKACLSQLLGKRGVKLAMWLRDWTTVIFKFSIPEFE